MKRDCQRLRFGTSTAWGGPASPAAEIRTDATVSRTIVKEEVVQGVALENGDELRAPIEILTTPLADLDSARTAWQAAGVCAS